MSEREADCSATTFARCRVSMPNLALLPRTTHSRPAAR